MKLEKKKERGGGKRGGGGGRVNSAERERAKYFLPRLGLHHRHHHHRAWCLVVMYMQIGFLIFNPHKLFRVNNGNKMHHSSTFVQLIQVFMYDLYLLFFFPLITRIQLH